jgi:ribonucleases P/MRP protein subunit RPP40
MKCSNKLFADDTKIWKEIRSEDDQLVLQTDLNSLTEWSDEWLLRLHPDKCKVMHINHQFETTYYLQDSHIKTHLIATTQERDLGVIVTDKMKFSEQCTKAAAKANAMTGLIRRH